MEKKFADIILSGKSVAEINAELDAAGATFHLEEGRPAGWTEKELAEGFVEGGEAKVLIERPDMSRRVEFAGKSVIQTTKAGRYEVFYDIDGYAEKAVKVK